MQFAEAFVRNQIDEDVRIFSQKIFSRRCGPVPV